MTKGAAKRPFLVVYDYGMGGIWAYVLARSVTEIEMKFPELAVVDVRPQWLTADREARLRHRMYDIDNPGPGLLGDVLKERDADS